MESPNKKPFYWGIFSEMGRFLSPDFMEYKGVIGRKHLKLLSLLHEKVLQKQGSLNDANYNFIDEGENTKKLLIDNSKCGPSIEFYFHEDIPLFHSYTYDLKVDTHRDYIANRKHFLLTVTDEFENFYNSSRTKSINLSKIHSDQSKIYQLKLNHNKFICKRSNIEFLPIDEFFNWIVINFNTNYLSMILEKFIFQET